MKKLTIQLFSVILLSLMILSCNNSSDNKSDGNDSISDNSEIVKDNVDDNVKVNDNNDVAKDKIDFSKFEHYASILTKADLIAQFGQSNITDETQAYAEGTMEKEVSILKNPNNGYVIVYVWKDDNSTTDWIEASYNLYDSNWEIVGSQTIPAENGLYLGMSLSELRAWNGANFNFSGFGWDYSGFITFKEGSKISDSPIEISLDIIETDGTNNYDFVFGDVTLSADDARLKNAKILVSSMTMYVK